MKLRTKEEIVKIEVDDLIVSYKQITPHKLDDITKKHTKWLGRGNEMRKEVDNIAIAEDMFAGAIESWDGALDENGKKLPCTDKIKRDVFKYDQNFVLEVTRKYNDIMRQRREDTGKNS